MVSGIFQSYMNKIVRVYRSEGLYTLVYKIISRVRDFFSLRYIIIALLSRLLMRIDDRSNLINQATQSFQYSSSDKIIYQEPSASEPITREFSHVFGTHEFDQPTVCEIEDGIILKQTGIRTTNDGSILLETVDGRRDVLEDYLGKNLSYFIKLLLVQYNRETGSLDTYDYEYACPLMSIVTGEDGPGGFAGWVQNDLAKLEGLEHYAEQTGESPTIILEPDPPAYKIESLHAMGYDEEDYTTWDQKQTKIKKLVIPISRRPENNTSYYFHRLTREYNREYVSIAPSACKWIRSSARQHLKSKQTRTFSNKIIISRSDATRRRILNHEELINKLAPEGFKSYELSRLTFEETITMFSEADVVVAPHGAGLASTVFSQNCKIVEIFGYNIRPIFYMLAQNLDNDYGFVVGDFNGQDISVDVDRVISMYNLIQD